MGLSEHDLTVPLGAEKKKKKHFGFPVRGN